MDPNKILEQMGFDTDFGKAEISAFKNEEDGEDYAVWKVSTGENIFVLKEAKEYELEIYKTFLNTENDFAPRLYKTARCGDKDYFLMEYVPGESLMKCSREKLIMALDALVSMQDAYWEDRAHAFEGRSFEKTLEGRINRGKYLNDPELEKAYEEYLRLYRSLPRTLCHDDLLPFNVLVSEKRAVIIDWEVAGILPYPTSLARFIAHGTEDKDAFFYMTDSDREFAVQYYYDNLLRSKGIGFGEYRAALDRFLLYEYCEWVMLGNKYGDTDSERYRDYLKKAKQMAKKING